MNVNFKYGEKVLVPDRAVSDGTVTTSDGVLCSVSFDGAFREAMCLERLNEISMRMYGMSFAEIRGIWYSRLGVGSFEMWYLISLTRL